MRALLLLFALITGLAIGVVARAGEAVHAPLLSAVGVGVWVMLTLVVLILAAPPLARRIGWARGRRLGLWGLLACALGGAAAPLI